jgi:hypothetical protein
MNLRQTQSRALTEVYWSGSLLNSYTIMLLVMSPFLAALLLALGAWLSCLLMFLGLSGMLALSALEKPLLAYDPIAKLFFSPFGAQIRLEDVDRIEINVHDLYVIPKSPHIKAWHMHQRVWTLVPRRVLQKLAAQYGWPLMDVTHPALRFIYWVVP